MLSRQEIFNIIYNGLKSQGFKQSILLHSGKYDGECQYRGPDGLKCAIGHLIPDKVYDSSFEGQTIQSLQSYPNFQKWLNKNFSKNDQPWLLGFQRIHDRLDITPSQMQSELMRLAQDNNLLIPK